MKYIDKIKELDACDEAVLWLENSGHKTLQKAWDNCKRADWMLWFIRRTIKPSADRKPLILIACECARVALPIWEKRYPDDARVRKCIETTEKYAAGEATIKQVREGRLAAYAAAAGAAAYAAYVAGAAAAGTDARAKARKECAGIVRKHYPKAYEWETK